MKDDCCTVCLFYPLITLAVSLVKISVMIAPLTVALVGGMCGTALLLYPLDLFYLYRALITSPQFSKKLKTLLIPLMLPLTIIWLALVPVASIIVLLGLGIIYPFVETSGSIYGGEMSIVNSEIPSMAKRFVTRFWTDHYYEFYESLESLRKQTDPPTFYDLKFKGLFTGLLLTLSTLVVSLSGFSTICIIKVIPGILRALYLLTKNFFNAEVSFVFLFLCPYIVGMALIPVLCLLAATFIMLGAPFYCAGLALTTYYEKDAKSGALEAYKALRSFDEYTNEAVFTLNWTILPRLSDVPMSRLG